MKPEIAADIFRALGVPSRMHILMLLKSSGPLPVKAIAEKLGMTSPAVSQHLKILRHVGLVSSERQGYWVPYAVDTAALTDSCGMMIQMCACPSCHGHPHDHADEKTETGDLLRRREKLLAKLQHVEEELDRLRGG